MGDPKDCPRHQGFAAELAQLQTLIADDAAISDIEIHCASKERCNWTRGWWYDTTELDAELLSQIEHFDADRKFIDRAIRYLDLRGLLVRKPEAPHVVSFRPVTGS